MSGASVVTVKNWPAWPPLLTQKILPTHTSFCHWAAPEYSDIGQTVLHTVLSAISFAVAIWSAIEQRRVFDMRYEIAKGYANIAQEQWNRFNGTYKPLETSMIAVCSSETTIKPDYAKNKSEFTPFVDTALGQAQAELDRYSKAFCLCPVNGSMTANSALKDDVINFSYREREEYALDRDVARFNRRSSLLNMGRDLLSDSAKYSGSANDLLSGAGESQAAATQSAFTALGYLRNRFATSYPNYVMSSSSAGVTMSQGGDSGGMPGGMSMDSA
jgi:hypothetical protein